jgi:hypothetical protein
VKSAEEIMKMLEAFDLTGSLRDAAELAGCSHHTVARHATSRAAAAPARLAGRRDPRRTRSPRPSRTSDRSETTTPQRSLPTARGQRSLNDAHRSSPTIVHSRAPSH